MRIALVTDGMEGLTSGIERHMFELAIAQKARGDDPVVVVPESGELTAACEEHGISISAEVRHYGPSAIDDLCSLFTTLGVEIIHSHTPNPAVIAAGNKLGIPCVYTHHVQRRFRMPDLEFTVIAAGGNAFDRLKEEGFPRDKVYYIPNGTRVMPRVTAESLSPSLMAVGRLEYIKGFDIAILAMAELRRRHGLDCPMLNVYGAGSLEGLLKEMTSVLHLDNRVRFHGVQVGIIDHCPATDILIVSSRSETGPLVALEAMSRGMPIVATRVGEIERIIPDRRFGYVVENISIAALADGIDSILSDVRAGRFNPDLSISRHRELYSIEKMTALVDAVYKSLLTCNASVA